MLPQACIEQFQFPSTPPNWLDLPALKKHPYFPVIAAALPKHVVEYANSDDVKKFIDERYEACKNARTADAKASGKKRTQTNYNKAETDSMNRWYEKSGCQRGVKYVNPMLLAKYVLAKDFNEDNALKDRDHKQVHEKIKFLQEPLPQSTSSSSTTTTTKSASSSDSETSGSSDINQR